MDYATYIDSLWKSKDIALLYQELANVPHRTFYVSKGKEGTVELNFNMIKDLLRYYKSGDITATFKHIQQHWGDEVYLQMPDGRTIVNDQNLFIDIYTTNRPRYNSGLKFHLPVHVNDVNKMEVIMKKMYNINPNFMYKYAPKGLGGKQVGKVLTIYAAEGLDTPKTLHKFTKQLLYEMEQSGIRTYSPADLKRANSNPNLLNDKVEWQVKGAEGKIYYSYDGHSSKGYRGNLKYDPKVKTGEYVSASGGDRRHYKAINDPFEYEVDLNYDHPRTAYNGNNKNHPNQNPPQQKVIQIGEGMGDAAQENVRELYERAKEYGLTPERGADRDKTPNSYRLILEDTPEARSFLKENLSSDGKSITQKIIFGRKNIGTEGDLQINELYNRAQKEGVPVKKYRATIDHGAYKTMPFRLEFENTPQTQDFFKRNVAPNGRDVIGFTPQQRKTPPHKQKTAEQGKPSESANPNSHSTQNNTQQKRTPPYGKKEAHAENNTHSNSANNSSQQKSNSKRNTQSKKGDFAGKTAKFQFQNTDFINEFIWRAENSNIPYKVSGATNNANAVDIEIPVTNASKRFIAANIHCDGSFVAPQVANARLNMPEKISLTDKNLKPDDLQELIHRAKKQGIQIHSTSNKQIHFYNTAEARVFLESNLNSYGSGIETPEAANKKFNERQKFQVDNIDLEKQPKQSTPPKNTADVEIIDDENLKQPQKNTKRKNVVDAEIIDDTNFEKQPKQNTPHKDATDVDLSSKNNTTLLKKALNNSTSATKKAATTITRGVQAVGAAQANLVNKISSIPGGAKALKAANTVNRFASKAAGPLVLLSAALDPKGSREFVDDVANLRIGKIANEAWEGTTQMVLHPVDTAQAMYDMASDAVRNRYKDAETVGDYVAETANAAGKGFLNIGDTVWGSISSLKTAQARSINWLLQRSGSNTQIATDTLSYEAYKRDPIAFLGNLIVPTTVNTETGLRSDDDLMSLISQDNPKALEAYIAKGKEDVNRNIQGSYHGNNHSPYNTALQFAVASGNIKVAQVLYQQNGVNYNGKNSSTLETTVMTLIRHNAPDQDDPSFLTGKPKASEFSDEKYAEYMTTQAMIDDLILNKKIDINTVNFAGQDAFLVAAESGNVATATLCLERGSNINKTALNGWNALHYCNHNQEMVSMLLEQGINANQANKRGETPLMFSLAGKPTKRNTNSVSMLLLASNEEGLNRLKASPKHLNLLDKLMEEHPESKDIIFAMEGHPLQAFFKERYPDDAATYEAQLSLENEQQNKNEIASPSQEDENTQIDALFNHLTTSSSLQNGHNAENQDSEIDNGVSFKEVPAPREEAPEPVQQAPVNTTAPREEAPEPVQQAPANTPAPREEAPVNTTAPREEAPAPVQQDPVSTTEPITQGEQRVYQTNAYAHAKKRLANSVGTTLSGVKLTNKTLSRALQNIENTLQQNGYNAEDSQKQAQMLLYKVIITNKLYHPNEKIGGTKQTFKDLIGANHRQVLKMITQNMSDQQKQELFSILQKLEDTVSKDGFAIIDVNSNGYSFDTTKSAGYTQKEQPAQPKLETETSSPQEDGTPPKEDQQPTTDGQSQQPNVEGHPTRTLDQNAQPVPNETNDALAQTRADQATR